MSKSLLSHPYSTGDKETFGDNQGDTKENVGRSRYAADSPSKISLHK